MAHAQTRNSGFLGDTRSTSVLQVARLCCTQHTRMGARLGSTLEPDMMKMLTM